MLGKSPSVRMSHLSVEPPNLSHQTTLNFLIFISLAIDNPIAKASYYELLLEHGNENENDKDVDSPFDDFKNDSYTGCG